MWINGTKIIENDKYTSYGDVVGGNGATGSDFTAILPYVAGSQFPYNSADTTPANNYWQSTNASLNLGAEAGSADSTQASPGIGWGGMAKLKESHETIKFIRIYNQNISDSDATQLYDTYTGSYTGP